MKVRIGLPDWVHKIAVVLPPVVPPTLFYEPNQEADVDRCKLTDFIYSFEIEIR